MSEVTILKRELKAIVKESVREVLVQELMRLRAVALPFVSSKEQKNIERLYKKPSNKPAKIIEVSV